MKTLTNAQNEIRDGTRTKAGLKILIISNLYPPHILGGYEILCGQVVDRLREWGHDVQVITTNHAGATSSDGVERSLRLYAEFGPPTRVWRWRRVKTSFHNAAVAAEAIRRVRPDIIFHWSALRLTMGAARVAEASGIPVLYTFNDENIRSFSPSPWKRPHRALLDHTICRHATTAGLKFANSTCISALLKRNLLARGLPIPSSRVIHQGIPVSKFPMKELAGGVHSPLRVLYAGQLHDYKGVHTAIEACHLLAARTPVEMTIAGAGDAAYEQRLRRMASEGSALVMFTGKLTQKQLSEQYRRADVFVFPSEWHEPFGLTHLEAMASGTPTISTTHGGQGEFIHDGINALSMPARDPQALAQAMERVRADKALRMRLIYTARRIVETRFTLDRYARQIEALLLEVRRKHTLS